MTMDLCFKKKSRGPWPVCKSMLRAPLSQEVEKGKPVSPQVLNGRRLLGEAVAKSHVVPAAAGITGDFKTVEQQDPMLASQIITVDVTQIAALVNEPLKRFLQINKNLIVINGDIFEHLAPEAMCPHWQYEEMACADTLICRFQIVIDNMYEVLDTEKERRLNDDFNAPRIGKILRIPIFSRPTKAKQAGDPTLFNISCLLISSPDCWSRKVKFRRYVLCWRGASHNKCSLFADSELSDVSAYSSTGDEGHEFGGHLPIAHVMWYFDIHLHHLKQTPGFTAAFAFIDHQPDLACKIASIEPDSRIYLFGVSTDSAADWVNKMQNQLNHILTQGSKLDESGDWDQQANWTNCGIPLVVRDDKYGSDACKLKEEEMVQKGQAAAAQDAAAKRKSTFEEPDPNGKKTASKPKAVNFVAGEHTDESDGDEEEVSEEDDRDERQVLQGKTAKKPAVRPGSEESRGRLPFKQPTRQSAPREQPAKPPPKGKTSVANYMGAKMQAVPKKK